jgi:hypothetical protein
MMKTALNVLFVIAIVVVLLDGIILLATPERHAMIVNRWNELMHIPARVPIERYRGLGWRLSGLFMVAFALFVIYRVSVG